MYIVYASICKLSKALEAIRLLSHIYFVLITCFMFVWLKEFINMQCRCFSFIGGLLLSVHLFHYLFVFSLLAFTLAIAILINNMKLIPGVATSLETILSQKEEGSVGDRCRLLYNGKFSCCFFDSPSSW